MGCRQSTHRQRLSRVIEHVHHFRRFRKATYERDGAEGPHLVGEAAGQACDCPLTEAAIVRFGSIRVIRRSGGKRLPGRFGGVCLHRSPSPRHRRLPHASSRGCLTMLDCADRRSPSPHCGPARGLAHCHFAISASRSTMRSRWQRKPRSDHLGQRAVACRPYPIDRHQIGNCRHHSVSPISSVDARIRALT